MWGESRLSLQVELADEQPFRIGDLLVDPARLRVERGGECHKLEARVMQVLVVLGRANGHVVSRSELVDRCWDGRIVGENAIQRVISRLRHLSATPGGFELETVHKVGYIVRPTVADIVAEPAEALPESPPDEPPPPNAWRSRRSLLAGAAILASGLASAVWWAKTKQPEREPEVAQLLAAGRAAQAAGTLDQIEQAVIHYRRATELAPDAPDPWGALASAYVSLLDVNISQDQPMQAVLAREAARRALSLDSRNPDARLALASIQPNLRNWASKERALRPLAAAYRDHAATHATLGWLLADVGRWREAIDSVRRAVTLEPLNAGYQMMLAVALWRSGAISEAARHFEATATQWPVDPWIWFERFIFLSTTGAATEALRSVRDAELRDIPINRSPLPLPMLSSYAIAMASGSPAKMAAAGDLIVQAHKAREFHSVPAACLLQALGRTDNVFGCLERFHFEGGRPLGPYDRRPTAPLLSSTHASLRDDPRFASMLRRLGLDAYWRETGSLPDMWPIPGI